MMSFMRGGSKGAVAEKGTTAAEQAAEKELGLAWIRQTLQAKEKLQKANEVVSATPNVQICPAIFGENFYPPTYEPQEEEPLRIRLEKEVRNFAGPRSRLVRTPKQSSIDRPPCRRYAPHCHRTCVNSPTVAFLFSRSCLTVRSLLAVRVYLHLAVTGHFSLGAVALLRSS